MEKHQQPNHHLQEKGPRNLQEKPAFEGKWLGMKYINYSNGKQIIQNYEAIYRTTRIKKGNVDIDGVQLIPIIKYKEKPSEIVLIANYRAPIGKFCLQFPSGLIDDENIEQNAKRQTKQQAGYIVKQLCSIPNPNIYSDPWKSTQSQKMFIGIIDGDDPAHYVGQQLQTSQIIKVHKLPFDKEFSKNVLQLAKQHNYEFSARTWCICVGMMLAQLIK